MNPTVRVAGLGLGAVAIVLIIAFAGKLIETLDAGEVMVIQHVGGELECHTTPGPKWQGFGTVQKYPRLKAYQFDMVGAPPAMAGDTGKELQFNDGGKAHLYGTVNWEMPADCPSIIAIHKKYNSPAGVESLAVSRSVNSAVYLSGPVMSSTESAAERRADLISLIDDQAQRGAYQMASRTVERPDPITGEKRSVIVAEIVRDAAGQPKRQQGSVLAEYNIHLQPVNIEKLAYDDSVTKQILERQKATQAVQLAQANARKAEQDAITAAKQGEAKAAEAKWAQESLKATAVTKGEQELAVAVLSAKTAEQWKREQVLRGEGEAERKKLVMAADGALDQKLEAYKAVQAKWADAFGAYTGAMVPAVTMGQGQGGATAVGNAQALVEMLTAKTARDLSLDLSNVGTRSTPQAAVKQTSTKK